MNLSNKTFDLIENNTGLAASQTRMIFNHHSDPFEATYTGPNVSNGHVLVSRKKDKFDMIYHALSAEGLLVAGKADVSFSTNDGNLIMQLNWQWLTDDLSSGVSLWTEVIH